MAAVHQRTMTWLAKAIASRAPKALQSGQNSTYAGDRLASSQWNSRLARFFSPVAWLEPGGNAGNQQLEYAYAGIA